MELFAISGLAGGLVSFLFGCFILLKDSQSMRSRVFFMLALSGAVWGGAYWQWLANSSSASEAVFWVGVLSVGSVMMPTFLYHWVMLTTKAPGNYWRLSVYVLYIFSILVSATAWTPLLIQGVEAKAIFPYWPVPGPLYLPHIVFLYALPLIISMARVIHIYLISKSMSERGGMMYVFLGIIAGGLGAASNFFLWFDIEVLPYGNFLIILFPILLGYSMIQYKIFTVRSVATEMLLLLLNVFVFVRMLLADTSIQLLIELVFFMSIATASYMLLRGIYSEIKASEKLREQKKKLKKLNKRLKDMDEKKTEFLHVATHQLRGPVAAINGYASLMQDGDFGKLSKEQVVPLQKILASSKVMTDTINDYMDIARIEEKNLVLEQEDFKLCALVKERADILRISAEKKGIKLVVKPLTGKSCKVHADKKNITQVLNALLENAIKYTIKGTVTVQAERSEDGTRAIVHISDSGIGVPRAELEGLFTKFSRASNAKESSVGGTGMGLFIAKSLMEANGGSISVHSEGLNKGTTFTIELPLVS